MSQLNINVTPEFERHLRQYMRQRKLTRKSDAIREALREAVERGSKASDFRKTDIEVIRPARSR